VNAQMIIEKVYKETDILLGEGQGEWKEKVIRIAHMGYIEQNHIQKAVESIRKNL
jgi:aspartate aminotransferase-like enzyme